MMVFRSLERTSALSLPRTQRGEMASLGPRRKDYTSSTKIVIVYTRKYLEQGTPTAKTLEISAGFFRIKIELSLQGFVLNQYDTKHDSLQPSRRRQQSPLAKAGPMDARTHKPVFDRDMLKKVFECLPVGVSASTKAAAVILAVVDDGVRRSSSPREGGGGGKGSTR